MGNKSKTVYTLYTVVLLFYISGGFMLPSETNFIKIDNFVKLILLPYVCNIKYCLYPLGLYTTQLSSSGQFNLARPNI